MEKKCYYSYFEERKLEVIKNNQQMLHLMWWATGTEWNPEDTSGAYFKTEASFLCFLNFGDGGVVIVVLLWWWFFFFFGLYVCWFLRQVSVCSHGCTGTHYVDHHGLKLRDLPVSTSQVLDKAEASNSNKKQASSLHEDGVATKIQYSGIWHVHLAERLFSFQFYTLTVFD